MVQVKKYYLSPTALIPNSPQPLLHYTDLDLPKTNNNTALHFHELFAANGWKTQWIFRYGQTQRAHYHSGVHECMAVLSGKATIRFGVADTSPDLEANTTGSAREDGGIEVEARAGDVFVLPAGTAHKTFDTQPEAEFALLTPGDGHGIDGDAREVLGNVRLDGFTMLGAYPVDGGEWDFMEGGENEGQYEKVWAAGKPESDPVLGKSGMGICSMWT